MKRIAAVIAMTLAAATAYAADNQALCENLADFSGLVATQRDAGMPLIEMRNQINQAPMRSDVRKLFLQTAGTIYMDQQFASLNSNGVRARVFRNCLAVVGE